MPSGLRLNEEVKQGRHLNLFREVRVVQMTSIATGFTLNHSSLHSAFATLLHMILSFMKKNVV
jgi:hypothetical protein